MTLERIHFFILSLAIRLLGIFFLFHAIHYVFNAFIYLISALRAAPSSVDQLLESILWGLANLLVAAYLLKGAPPVLKWVQEFPKIDPPST